MATEAKRGCGYRKVGGLYLMGGKLEAPCCWLPFPLDICPTCGGGIKPCRGWTWVTPSEIFAGKKCILPGGIEAITRGAQEDITRRFKVGSPCPLPGLEGRHGLLWIGVQFYPTPEHYTQECATQGLSRRIQSVPKDFVLGETWVLLAHAKAVRQKPDPSMIFEEDQGEVMGPGIFAVFKPTHIDILVKESELTDEKRAELAKRGLTPVAVPDDDPDHCPRKAA